MSSVLKTVALRDVRFYAYHGYYPEEQQIGGVFYVDIVLSLPAACAATDELADTLNYEVLFAMAKEEMQKTSKLIETPAQHILNRVLVAFPTLTRIEVNIRKAHPPLAGELAYAEVSLIHTNDSEI
ncbi:MAG: dihydroneopterin aldolase [Sphingobacteriaceae bacterium]|nr:dihydroneopterin aldolase [Sphingobacteriaceae bacterium]